MAIAEVVVVERGLEVSPFPVDRVGIVLDDGGGDASGVVMGVVRDVQCTVGRTAGDGPRSGSGLCRPWRSCPCGGSSTPRVG